MMQFETDPSKYTFIPISYKKALLKNSLQVQGEAVSPGPEEATQTIEQHTKEKRLQSFTLGPWRDTLLSSA